MLPSDFDRRERATRATPAAPVALGADHPFNGGSPAPKVSPWDGRGATHTFVGTTPPVLGPPKPERTPGAAFDATGAFVGVAYSESPRAPFLTLEDSRASGLGTNAPALYLHRTPAPGPLSVNDTLAPRADNRTTYNPASGGYQMAGPGSPNLPGLFAPGGPTGIPGLGEIIVNLPSSANPSMPPIVLLDSGDSGAASPAPVAIGGGVMLLALAAVLLVLLVKR